MLKVYGSFDNSDFTLAQTDLDLNKLINYNLINKNYFLNSSWKTMAGKNTTFTTSASFTSDNDDVAFENNAFEKKNRGVHFKEVVSQEINARTTLRAGAEWLMNSYDQYWHSADDSVRLDYQNHTLAAFAEAELYASKRFVTRIGIRAEQSSYLDRVNIAPRLTAAYKLNETSQFSAAYGWFHQNPAHEFMVYSHQLDFERADHYTLSYQSSKNERTLRAEIYYKDYSNLVRQLPGTFYLPDNYNNTGNGYAKGIDLFWRDKKSIKNGDYWVSYSWLDTKRDYRDYPEMATPSFASAHNLAVVYKHWFGGIYISRQHGSISPGESLGQFAQSKTTDDFRALGNRFNLIASNEINQWLPFYYHAQCYIILSFMEAQGSPNKDLYLDEAEKSIKRIIELASKEADVWALQGMLFTARLVVNPMERGQKYSMMSAQSIGTSLGIDPANPRARLLKLQNDMGMAEFLGRDTKEFCDSAKQLVNEWDSYSPKSPLHPRWGKSQAEEVVKECNYYLHLLLKYSKSSKLSGYENQHPFDKTNNYIRVYCCQHSDLLYNTGYIF